MRELFLVLLGFALFVEFATTTVYYVDCLLGDDNFNGMSENEAWKSLTKVSNENFQTGDSILLKAGCRFYHQFLNLTSLKGTANDVTTVSRYGDGENPVIDCSLLIEENFEVVSDDIFSADINRNKEITQLLVHGTPYKLSHYPSAHNDFLYTRTDAGEAGRLKVRAEDFNFLGVDYPSKVNGSRVCVRRNHYTWSCRDIIDINGFDFIFAEDTVGARTELRGYKLTNKFWMLEKGNWYFDGNKLFLRTGVDPNEFEIRISDIEDGIIMEENENVLVENITILYPAKNGIRMMKNCRNVNLMNLEVIYSAHTGVTLVGGKTGEDISDITIENCKFFGSGVRGIHVRNIPWCPPSGVSRRVNVIRNTIERTFVEFTRVNHAYEYLCMYHIGTQHGTSIIHEAEDSVIELNTIIDTGYIGIYFSGNNSIVRRNFINNSCLLLDDCGMIYTYGELWHGNAIISDNVLLNSWGNKYGTECFLNSCFESPTGFQAMGIYLDNMSKNTTVINNFVFNTEMGLFMNKPLNNIMRNNIAVYSKNWGFQTNDYFNPNSLNLNATGNIIENNVIHTKKNTILYMGNSQFQNIDHCDFKNNYLLSTNEPQSSNNMLLLNFVGASNDVYFKHCNDLNGREGDENNKDFPPKWFQSEKFKFDALGQNLFYNPTFDTNISDWSEWSHSGGQIIQEWSSEYGGSLKVYKDHPLNDLTFCSIISNPFEVKNGTKYVLKFSGVVFSTTSLRLYCLVQNTDFATNVYFKNEMTDYGYIVTGSSDSTSSFVCYDGPHMIVFYFDNFTFVPANNIQQHYPTQDFDWVFNIETEPRMIELDNKRCDIDGNVIDNMIYLEPRESKLLMKCFCNFDGVCNNFENANSCPECDPVCGNLVCEEGESPWNCPSDCFCGNGVCEREWENANNCSIDCNPICGNFICEQNENFTVCPEDCEENESNKKDPVVGIILAVVFSLLGIICILIFAVVISVMVWAALKKKKENESDENATELVETDTIT